MAMVTPTLSSSLHKGPPPPPPPLPCLVLPRSSPPPPLPPPPRRGPSFCRVARRPCSSLVDETVAQIQSSGVIACLRYNSAELAMEAARAALSGGISVLEIVVSTPGVFEVVKNTVLQQLVHDYPTTVLGVGTVLSVEDAKKAVGAGAKFLMSPAMVKDVMDGFQHGEVLYIPGAMTPTEILYAHDAGAKMVKVYPVSALGGVNYISAIKKAFSHISMVASQGITMDSIGDYIAKGASSVVLSDAIFNKEAMARKNFEAISKLANFAALQGKEAVAGLGKYTTGKPVKPGVATLSLVDHHIRCLMKIAAHFSHGHSSNRLVNQNNEVVEDCAANKLLGSLLAYQSHTLNPRCKPSYRSSIFNTKDFPRVVNEANSKSGKSGNFVLPPAL